MSNPDAKVRIRIYMPSVYVEYIVMQKDVWVDRDYVEFTDEKGKRHKVINTPIIVDYDYETNDDFRNH